MSKIISLIYSLLIISFILPSGSLFGVPIKLGLSLLLLVCILLSKKHVTVDKVSRRFLISFIALIIWSIISTLNGFSGTIIQFVKNYFSLILVIWFSYFLNKNDFIDYKKIIKLIVFDSAMIICIKLLLSLSLSLGFTDVSMITMLYKSVFNTDLTTMYFPIGGFTFYRLMLSNDSIPLVSFSFFLISNSKKSDKLVTFFIVAIYTFVIFSRVILVQFALIVFISLMVFLRKKIRDKAKFLSLISIIGVIGLVTGIVLINYSGNEIVQAILFRFHSSSVVESDRIRNEQFVRLFSGFSSSPFLGFGTGAYLRDYLRSDTTMFSYELEYLSFLYQFGLVGFILIIGYQIYAFFCLCYSRKVKKEVLIMIFFNLFIWGVKPFFNPSFLSSNSGFIILCIFFYKEKNEDYYLREKNMFYEQEILLLDKENEN